MKHPWIIETKRLWLRAVNPLFVHDLFRSHTKEEIMQYLDINEVVYEHWLILHQKGMETHRFSMYFFLLFRKSDERSLGECGFHTWYLNHHRGELFYMLRQEEFKRQGYMQEAMEVVMDYGFKTMSLHRIEAKVADDNMASIGLLRRNHFSFEGTLREDYCLNGEHQSSDCYSLLRWEWEQAQLKS